jgi:hypothetical protein
MSDDPMHDLPAFNRVSIRAVLVSDGEDLQAALAAAGLVDPVAVPVVLGDEPHPPDGILGDGITPNLTAVLETEQEEAFDAVSDTEPSTTGAVADGARPTQWVTTRLPAAFGKRPLAPVGKAG